MNTHAGFHRSAMAAVVSATLFLGDPFMLQVAGESPPSRGPAPVFDDDFNDGNDDGWTRSDTLGDAGQAPPADYVFPGGDRYRISGPGAAIQWARPVSYVTECIFSDFHIEVDVTAHSAVNQSIGILARLSDPGFGGNRAYSLNYNPATRLFAIWRITADHPSGISVLAGANVDPGVAGFRLAFTGAGQQLTGRIFALSDPAETLATLTAEDAAHASGLVGIATIAHGGGIRTDATFDNFRAYVEPPDQAQPLEFQSVSLEAGALVADLAGAAAGESIFVLESNDLDLWRENTSHHREGALLRFPLVEGQTQSYYRAARSLGGIRLQLNLSGRIVPSTAEQCQEIQEHIPEELTEGAAVRLFFKDAGAGDWFGNYQSEFALDLFVALVEGFEEPVPVATSGWLIQTREDGSKTFWQTASQFQSDGSAAVRSEILWGTDRFDGVAAVVEGLSYPEDPGNAETSPYLYEDSGWIRFAK